MTGRTESRGLAIVGLFIVALAISGCGGDDAPAREALPPTPDAALWNPCDGLDPADVAEQFATEFVVDAGSPHSPRCTFTPSAEGEPAIDVNYQIFPDDLDVMFQQFGVATDGPDSSTAVQEVAVADATDARIVVNLETDTLAVTGFVKNGDLVQLVNVVDPAPHDRGQVVRGVREMLSDLSAHAATSGLE